MDRDPANTSLRSIAARVDAGDVDEALLDRLARDPRAGAACLLARIRKRNRRQADLVARLECMLDLERARWSLGAEHIAGVDEAGMGPLAGPVVAAAVILDRREIPLGIDDSKRLDENTRRRLADEIRASAVAAAVGIADIAEIECLNIYHAGLLAMRRAVEGLARPPCHLFVDARSIPGLEMEQTAYISGDTRSASIAAASIVAKTTRDTLMEELDAKYPGYGFSRHKGYGTLAHREAIRRLGPCPEHRISYAAVRELIGR